MGKIERANCLRTSTQRKDVLSKGWGGGALAVIPSALGYRYLKLGGLKIATSSKTGWGDGVQKLRDL